MGTPNDELTATTSKLKFKVKFMLSESPKVLDMVDITNYAEIPALNQANVEIMFKIIDPLGTVIYSNDGYETNDFSSPDIVRGTTDTIEEIAEVTLDTVDAVVNGTYQFYAKYHDTGNIAVIYTTSKSYYFNYETPEVSIDVTHNSLSGVLTSSDVTSYIVHNSSNENVSPTTITYDHKIVQPEGAGMDPVPGSANARVRTIGGGATAETQIWTGVYQTYITTTLYYQLELWGSSYWIVVNDIATGYEPHTVSRDECASQYFECLKTLQYRYEDMKGKSNIAAMNSIKDKILELNFYWMIYNWSIITSNTDSATEVSLKIKQIFQATVSCSGENDAIPSPIIPISSQQMSGGGNGSQILYGSDSPDPELGSNGDTYIVSEGDLIGNVYNKSGGVWILKLNIVGEQGETGISYSILDNQISNSGSIQASGGRVLKAFDLKNLVLGDGDEVHITSHVICSALDMNFGLILKLDSSYLLNKTYDELLSQTNFIIHGIIKRIDSSNLLFETFIEEWGTPANRYFGAINNITNVDWVNDNLRVGIYYSKGQAGSANDIICKYLTVELKSKEQLS